MNRDDPPTLPPASVPTEPTSLVLPRPNLGPELWSDPASTWGPTELVLGSVLTLVILGFGVGWWLRKQSRGPAPAGLVAFDPTDAANHTPSRRLIASSHAIRSALIAEFGPTWGSRTTEEVALDPRLADRLGPAAAQLLGAYLEQVDRAKFAGEELTDVDEWLGSARVILTLFSRPSAGQRAP